MRIYLAGPDVFRPDAAAWAASARTLCQRYGFEALTPLDHAETDAPAICAANLDLIRQAQVLVANLNPFRGAEPDSGTCFEIGYAHALDKPIHGYIAHMESLRERLNRIEGAAPVRVADSQGMTIENFDLPLNLMIAVPARIVEGGLEDCLKALRSHSAGAEASLPLLPQEPRARAAQEAAMRYLRWVADGRISDPDPLATVAKQYEVGQETMRQWQAAWAAVPVASSPDYRPDDVVRLMMISGRQYRRLK